MLDRSMLRKPKCMCCIPMETGCFIFGVFNSVLSGFGVIMLTIAQMLFNSTVKRNMQQGIDEGVYPYSTTEVGDILAAYAGMLLLYLIFLSSLIFSVFLCYGTHKKRPGFVKAYLVYGVVLTVLMMAGAILYSWVTADIVSGSIMLIVCGVYSMLLLMVQRTHELIRAQKARENSQLLPNIEFCEKA